MEFMIYSKEQAKRILEAYKKCGICSECALHSPEGWKCSYLAEQARKYLKKKKK